MHWPVLRWQSESEYRMPTSQTCPILLHFPLNGSIPRIKLTNEWLGTVKLGTAPINLWIKTAKTIESISQRWISSYGFCYAKNSAGKWPICGHKLQSPSFRLTSIVTFQNWLVTTANVINSISSSCSCPISNAPWLHELLISSSSIVTKNIFNCRSEQRENGRVFAYCSWYFSWWTFDTIRNGNTWTLIFSINRKGTIIMDEQRSRLPRLCRRRKWN